MDKFEMIVEYDEAKQRSHQFVHNGSSSERLFNGDGRVWFRNWLVNKAAAKLGRMPHEATITVTFK